MVYRSILYNIKVSFTDFKNYYEDAKSIGFTHGKALDYAFKSCIEKQKEEKEENDLS